MRLSASRRPADIGEPPAEPDLAGDQLHPGIGQRAERHRQSHVTGGVRRGGHDRPLERHIHREAGQARPGTGHHDHR